MTFLLGKPVPPFEAPAAFPVESMTHPVRTVSTADYRDKWMVIVWYPMDFTFVCPTELIAMSDRLDEFRALDADVLAISTDSVYSHRAWLRTSRKDNGVQGLRYPLASDKSHQIARSFGVLVDEAGVSLRGLFIVDPDGIVQYAVVQNMNTGRSVEETLRVLAALQTDEMCGSDWKPGQATLSSLLVKSKGTE